MTAYPVLEPPFSPRFDSFSAEQANEFFEWFTSVIPSRIRILAAIYSGQFGGEPMVVGLPCFTRLGGWFADSLETRKLSFLERMRDKMSTPSWVHPNLDDYDLSYVSKSICVDMGMLLGEVYRSIDPRIHWELCLKNKYVYYNHPVISGFESGISLNPPQIMMNIACRIVDGADASNEFTSLAEACITEIQRKPIQKSNRRSSNR